MTELQRYEAPRESDDWAAMLPAIGDLAQKIAGTNFVPAALRGKPAEVAACVLTGREIGVGPMESLQKIHIIEGRPSLSAELMRSLVYKAGHQLRIVESTPTRCIAEGKRRGDEEWTRVSWSMDDARKAGLGTRGPWTKHPRQMLSARATSELCRLIFPDALGGISYTPEEIEDMTQPETTVTVARADAPKRTAKRAAPVPEEPPLDAEVVEPHPTETEPPSDASEDGITDQQRKLLIKLMTAAGFTDRDDVLAWCTQMTGRPIGSRNELSKDEASHCISLLVPVEDPPMDPWASIPGGGSQ